jgi:hypothetical protein
LAEHVTPWEKRETSSVLEVNPEGKGQLARLGERVIFKCILKSDRGVDLVST